MQGAYTASKFALEGWTETLAYEVAPFGIRVVLIEPGVVITPIFEKEYPPASPLYEAQGNRLLNLLLSNTRHGTMPEHAAAVILEAATSDEDRLRWTVGPDAEQLLERHFATSDADRLAAHRETDDEAYWAAMTKIYGPEVMP
jgi:NAD(P)-dependent dehydrogenase (short-subunit alcohol dehydrogenase family)